MKKIAVIMQIIIVAYVFGSCVRHMRPGRIYYEGYIYTIEGQPIRGLKVYPSGCQFFRCTEVDSIGGITNEHGYFKFEQAKFWIAQHLIITSEGGRIIDSIDRGRPIPLWLRHLEFRNYDDRTADTFFVDMEGKGRSFRVLQGDKRPKRSYYEGYIYTIEGHPIQGLRIYPSACHFLRWGLCKEADSIGGMTNEHGYFKFEQAKSWITRYLTIESDGKIIDSIDRGPIHKTLPSAFDDKTTDTFFVDMEGKGRSFRVLQGQERKRIPVNDF